MHACPTATPGHLNTPWLFEDDEDYDLPPQALRPVLAGVADVAALRREMDRVVDLMNPHFWVEHSMNGDPPPCLGDRPCWVSASPRAKVDNCLQHVLCGDQDATNSSSPNAGHPYEIRGLLAEPGGARSAKNTTTARRHAGGQRGAGDHWQQTGCTETANTV